MALKDKKTKKQTNKQTNKKNKTPEKQNNKYAAAGNLGLNPKLKKKKKSFSYKGRYKIIEQFKYDLWIR